MKRKTKQFLIPIKKSKDLECNHEIYPSHSISHGNIAVGYQTLAEELSKKHILLLDGYLGVDWNEVISSLITVFRHKGLSINTISVLDYLKSEVEINTLIEPYLGRDNPLFGFKTDKKISDFFDPKKLKTVQIKENVDINIVYGSGASQLLDKGHLVYFDLPKNELQYRMRANCVNNFGMNKTSDVKQMYKHAYFVDWVILNKEKKRILPDIDIIVDQQRPANPTWMTGKSLRDSLTKLSTSFFRVRPWFEPGVWGGTWIKDKFPKLNKEVPNYAWSFEMIVPENGLLFEDNDILLEVSFDMLMYHEQKNILGKASEIFKDEFPIRFNFLDTFKGDNLSVQCHPSAEYIKNEFGENFTQDETYYILDTGSNSHVYLGFQEDINPDEFKKRLKDSITNNEEVAIEKYVQKLPSHKHDLFLIPHGTVHCSSINNLVLEISATPYIYTFKMYDWLRLDLNGQARPLNLDHAFQNLNFERKGSTVTDTLISKPVIVENRKDWRKIYLPTHPDHFYEIYRYEFQDEISIKTLDQCHILMLVEGNKIVVEQKSISQVFHFAETFVIPAAAKRYKLINKSTKMAKVIVSFVKEEIC